MEDFLSSKEHDHYAQQQFLRQEKMKFDHQFPPQKRRGSCPGKLQSKAKGVLNKKLQPMTTMEIDRSKLWRHKRTVTTKERYEFLSWLYKEHKLIWLEQLLEQLEKKNK